MARWTRRARALTLVGPGRRFRRRIGWHMLLIFVPVALAALALALVLRERIEGLPSEQTVTVIWALYSLVVAVAVSSVALAFRNLFLRSENLRARRYGRYLFDETLGEGGMGIVRKAHSAMLKKPVAIKLVRPEMMTPDRVAGFEREAKITSQLTHPNTVEVYDHGRTPRGLLYCVMEFIDGLTLSELVLMEDALPEARVVHILKQVCASLAEAHGYGLIHRDIKPGNIMLTVRGGTHDFVKVLDFGLAKDITLDDQPEDAKPRPVGTACYIAPERIHDPKIANPATDLYSVGAVAWLLLTGRELFRGSQNEVLQRAVSETPLPPSEVLGREVDPELEAIVMRLLARDPASRPASALTVLEELESLRNVPPWPRDAAQRWWLDNKALIDRSREEILSDLGRARW